MLFLGLNFVTAKVFLGLSKDYVLTQFLAVFTKAKLLGSVHGVLARIINTLTRLFTHESYQLTLFTFFCHIHESITKRSQSVNRCESLALLVLL